MSEIGIVGGGIVGLTSALALHHAGHKVTVYESVRNPAELGVGINLLPHSVRVLHDLGLKDALDRTAIQTAQLSFHSADGVHIWTEPRGTKAGNPWPQYSIHRGRFQMLLMEAVRDRLGSDRLRTGHHLDSLGSNNQRAWARFVDKTTGEEAGTFSGDALIGADGLHSATRKILHPSDGPPHYSGLVLWRGAVETEPFLDGRSMFMAGDDRAKVVVYPIGGAERAAEKSLVNWVAELPVPVDVETADWNREVPVETFVEAFESWDFGWINVPELFRATEVCYEFPMIDRHPLDRWSFGRVSLAGDAAHAMRPNGSNGSNQGILDAEALANHLSSGLPVSEALSAYEAERLPPTAALTLANRKAGPERVMQWVADSCDGTCVDSHSCIDPEELTRAALEYKQLAGFDPTELKKLA